LKTIRIFTSSPGEVGKERDRAKKHHREMAPPLHSAKPLEHGRGKQFLDDVSALLPLSPASGSEK